jgi:hypothetical protein
VKGDGTKLRLMGVTTGNSHYQGHKKERSGQEEVCVLVMERTFHSLLL